MANFLYRNKKIIATVFLVPLILLSHLVYASVQEASTGISLCGNGVIDQGEECDGFNLAGQTCTSRGFSGGSLSCNSNCTINTSACTSGGGGGGGGGGGAIPSPTGIILSGRAYPGMKVTVLKDAQIAATTIADSAANFRVAVSGLSAGGYIFGVYSEDGQGRRSSLLTFPVTVTSGVTVEVGNIFIAPTIAVDKSEVKQGDNIAIFGQSVPKADITIQVSSEEDFFAKTVADVSGVYLYNLGTEILDYGSHFTKSKAAKDGEISSFSRAVSFLVDTKNVAKVVPTKCPAKADLNNNCRVNLVDFSIAAYWCKRPLSVLFAATEKEKLNGDGKIDLVDFSIMAFYWTG